MLLQPELQQATRLATPTPDVPARWVAPAHARLFLGLSVPAAAYQVFHRALAAYPQYIEKTLPETRWHATLAYLGDVENPQQYLSRLLKPLPQAYVPTVAVTHIGRGLHRMQLWGYINPSTILLNVQRQLVDRLKTMRFPLPKTSDDFIPHIHLANLYPMARGIGIADSPCAARFAFHQIHLYESIDMTTDVAYKIRASIPLT